MTDRPLFDCSPKMAAKLARCNEIARVQRALTMAAGPERNMQWTAEDREILYKVNIAWRWPWLFPEPRGNFQDRRNYFRNLNT